MNLEELKTLVFIDDICKIITADDSLILLAGNKAEKHKGKEYPIGQIIFHKAW
jgi:hypothetical protein